MVSFHQPWFQDALWSVVNWWRSPNPHHCRWPSSALHHPWLRLPWPGSSSTQDFHLSHDLNPGLGFSGCNWVLHLRPARWSDVRHPLRARWPWEGILFHWLSRGQVYSIIMFVKWFVSMRRQLLEKKPEKPFMMYLAFDDLQVLHPFSCLNEQMLSCVFIIFQFLHFRYYYHQQQHLGCFWLIFQGPLQVEEKWRDLYPYQVVAMMIIDKEEETAVSLSLHLTWPCWFVDDITRTDCWWQK